MKKRITGLGKHLNEDQKIYETEFQELLASDPDIKDQKDLEKNILDNIGDAFSALLKEKINFNYPTTGEYEKGGGRLFIRVKGKPITGDKLGVFKYGIKELYINFFSGGEVPEGLKPIEDDDKFEFKRFIWTTVNYKYVHGAEHTSGMGSNGCDLFFPGETNNSIWYDIIEKKFLTTSEAIKFEKKIK